MDDRKNVEANLRSVTQSCKGGVPLDRLERDYRDLLGTPIPYKELGFSNLKSLIADMPDVVKIERNGNQLVVVGIANELTSHIVDMVSKQRSAKRKPPKRQYRMQNFRGRGLSYYHPQRIQRFQANTPRFESNRVPFTTKKPTQRQVLPTTMPTTSSFSQFPRASSSYEVPPRFKREKEEGRKRDSVSEEGTSYIRNDLLIQITTNGTNDNRPVQPRISSPVPQRPRRDIPSTNWQQRRVEVASALPSPPSYSAHMSSKEFVEKYAFDNHLEIKYKTSTIGKKRNMYISKLCLGTRQFVSHPDESPTQEGAEELVASKAKSAIEAEASREALPETSISSVEDISELTRRINEIVINTPNGMWSSYMSKAYANKFHESLPQSWLDVTKDSLSSDIVIEARPDKDDFILRLMKSSTSDESSTSTLVFSAEESFSSEAELLTSSTPDGAWASLDVLDDDAYLDTNWPVHVTSILSTTSVTAKLINNEFKNFCDKVDFFYRTHLMSARVLIPNQLYVTHLEDENMRAYFRVQIEEEGQNSEQVSCYFVDVGYRKIVKKCDIQELGRQFESYKHQSMTLRLHNLAEYEDLINKDHLNKYLLEKKVIAEPIRRDDDGIIVVNLYDTSSNDDVNINELLRDLAIKECLALKPTLPEVGSSTMAHLLHITSQGEIYLKITNAFEDYIEESLEKLTPSFEASPAKHASELTQEALYVAKYLDESWYRAVIIEINEDNEAHMFYVDFGNTSWVPIKNLYELEQTSPLANLPYIAIPCELTDMPTSSELWTEEVIMKLYELVPETQELIVKVDSTIDNNIKSVSLYIRNEQSAIISINQTLALINTFKNED